MRQFFAFGGFGGFVFLSILADPLVSGGGVDPICPLARRWLSLPVRGSFIIFISKWVLSLDISFRCLL